MAQRSSTDLALVFLGLLAWAVAALFGVIPSLFDKVPALPGAGAACGFAIAGGLCFLGAAVASRPAGTSRTPKLTLHQALHLTGGAGSGSGVRSSLVPRRQVS
jgi:hypothetical protein